jgi:hypothetical protein
MLVSELSPPDEVDRLFFTLSPRRLRTVPQGGDSSALPLGNPGGQDRVSAVAAVAVEQDAGQHGYSLAVEQDAGQHGYSLCCEGTQVTYNPFLLVLLTSCLISSC